MYNYTDTFRLAMELSFQKAKELGAVEVTPDLLLYGVLNKDAKALDYLRTRGVETEFLLDNYEKYISQYTPRASEESMPQLGLRSRMAISEAVKRSGAEPDAPVTPMHLLLSVLEGEDDTYIKRLIGSPSNTTHQLGEDFVSALRRAYETLQAKASSYQEEEEEDDEAEDELRSTSRNATRSERRDKGAGGNKTPMLNKYGRDITALARSGKLDPVVGREKEIERMCQILARRRKRNPILIGEPGVGKTSLVEGLAQRIVEQNVPAMLISKRIVELDLSAVVAGTKYRGQFEERIKDILEELEASSDVIIYIDEIHTMVGAGGTSGSMDAANMLKPALARGEILCIGATTLEEYRKHIEKDGALERRFQKVQVEPSSMEETLEILKQLRPRYEEHHQVHFTDEALIEIVRLSDRYVNDRYFPDKAIDLMDEAGARLGSRPIEEESISPLLELEREHADYVARKLEAIKEQKFELAASYRNKERELEQAISEAKAKLQEQAIANYLQVEPQHIAEVLSMMTSIPIDIADAEREKLKRLDTALKSKVIGQDEVVERVARSIKRNRLGLRDARRPIGSFLFLGPTGVGKTYLVKCLAEELFGSSDALIRVDMSEYMEKFAVSRLVGAPPGYVGHDDGGQLTEQVRRRPYSIVLFDEIEKAHSDVFNILLQVLDEGYLTDSYGRRVDFRNTIIIITSNVGSREARSFGRGLGFQDGSKSESERTGDIIRKSLNRTFSPEFLNRLDEIVTFNTLSQDTIRQIVDVALKPLKERLQLLGYGLELDELALTALSKLAYHPEYGARPLRRALQSEVEDRLTDLILDDGIQAGDTLKLTAEEGKIKLDLAR